MNKVVQRLYKLTFSCLDDVAILSINLLDRVEHLRIVLCLLKEAGLNFESQKNHLGGVEVSYFVLPWQRVSPPFGG